MRLATIEDPIALARWLTIARANYPAPVELYVCAQGWELRCAQMRPYKIEHAPRDFDTELRELNEGTGFFTIDPGDP